MNGIRVAVFLAIRQLVDRWRLNGTAVFGIALGVLVLIGLTGVLRGFQEEFLSQILRVAPHARVVAEAPDDPAPLVAPLQGEFSAVEVRHARTSGRDVRISAPQEAADRLETHPQVIAACPGIEGRTMTATTGHDAGAVLLGIMPSRQDDCTPLSQYVVSGSWESLAGGRNRCALGAGLAESMNAQVGDRVRVATAGGGGEMLIVGAIIDTDVPALDDVRVYAPLRTAQAVLGRPDIVGHIDIRVRDPLEIDLVLPELAALVDVRVEGWREANQNLLDLFKLQNSIIYFVILAILVVGGFGILAIQVMLVLQKRRDIAILRAIGLQRADIVACFLLQGLLIAVAGALVGDILGALLLDLLRTLPVQSGGDIVDAQGFLIFEDPTIYVWGLAFGSLIGTLAGLFPALRAARVAPVDVLRGQVA